MEQLVLGARWPGMLAFVLGGLLLAWSLLMPDLAPRDLLRRARGRVEHALVPLVGPRAAPDVAGRALLAGGLALALGAPLLMLLLGPAGLLLAPLLAWGAGWALAQRLAARRRERLFEQILGLVQALCAGLADQHAAGGGVFGLLRRSYRQLQPPLQEELGFMELVLRGQADLGQALSRAAGESVDKHVRSTLELLALIYRESLDLPAQQRALRTLLQRLRQDEQVRRTVRIESRFGQTSQGIVLFLIPAFVGLAALAGSMLESQVSVWEFYTRTLPGRLILLGALLVELLVLWLSRRLTAKIRWE